MERSGGALLSRGTKDAASSDWRSGAVILGELVMDPGLGADELVVRFQE